MFGRQNAALEYEHPSLRDRLKSKVGESLMAQGEEIMRLRRELGYTDGFPLFERYLHSASILVNRLDRRYHEHV